MRFSFLLEVEDGYKEGEERGPEEGKERRRERKKERMLKGCEGMTQR